MGFAAMTAAVFVDRDGVLNATRPDGTSPRAFSEFTLLPGVAEATRRLRAAGFFVVVITNQPDIGRGLMALDDMDRMHALLRRELAIDLIEVCPHSGREGCECRKPMPGMLTRSATALRIDLDRSWTIGDRWVDVLAGHAAGTRTILIEQPYSWVPTSSGSPPADLVPSGRATDLTKAVDLIFQSGGLQSNG